MNVIVIGSKGFIGSYLTKYLYDHGHSVWQCDILSDYNTNRYFQIDASNAYYNQIFEAQKFDACINCSGAASVPDSIKNPYRDFLLNTSNVYAMLHSIHLYNSGCKFINLSSAAVYGNPKKLPITEDCDLMPMSPYGYHKLLSEQILKEFAIEFGEKTCSLRIFSAFGNGLRKQLFWDINKKMNSSKNAVFWGTGNETRDFIHVTDIVKIINLAIKNALFQGECINVANGEDVAISKAINLFSYYKHYSGDVSFNGNNREGDPKYWKADISIIKGWGYERSISLEEGIKEYVKWVENA